MSDLFGLSEAQVERLRPYFPKSRGKARVDDRRVLSRIIFIVRRQGFSDFAGRFVTEALARFLFEFRRRQFCLLWRRNLERCVTHSRRRAVGSLPHQLPRR